MSKKKSNFSKFAMALSFLSSTVFLYKTFSPEIENAVTGAKSLLSQISPYIAIVLIALGFFFLFLWLKR